MARVGADEDIPAQCLCNAGDLLDEVVDVGTLEQAAGDPDDVSNDVNAASAACGLVALESLT
jgi:hypothetical protein